MCGPIITWLPGHTFDLVQAQEVQGRGASEGQGFGGVVPQAPARHRRGRSRRAPSRSDSRCPMSPVELEQSRCPRLFLVRFLPSPGVPSRLFRCLSVAGAPLLRAS
jgi:hypothetical protein